MKRYRVGFSRVAEAQVDTVESWWRENRPVAPEMFRYELEAAGAVTILAVWYAGRGNGPRL